MSHLNFQRGSRHFQPLQVDAAATYRRGSKAVCDMLSQPFSIWNLHLVRCPVWRTHVCAVTLMPTTVNAVKTKTTVTSAQETRTHQAHTNLGASAESLAHVLWIIQIIRGKTMVINKSTVWTNIKHGVLILHLLSILPQTLPACCSAEGLNAACNLILPFIAWTSCVFKIPVRHFKAACL